MKYRVRWTETVECSAVVEVESDVEMFNPDYVDAVNDWVVEKVIAGMDEVLVERDVAGLKVTSVEELV